MNAQKKIGFWSVFGLVVGSQVGSGIFATPPALAPYGLYSILGWFISGSIAVILAIIFAILCMKFPRTGGPHVYAYEAFGEKISFFTGWTYWVVSWFSTPIVIITTINYLKTVIPIQCPFIWQIGVLVVLTLMNLRSVQSSSHVEFILTLFKLIPFTIIPIVGFFYFDSSNFYPIESLSLKESSDMLIITLFSFLGLECATAPAEFVKNPEKTIPKAIISGTVCVALLYILNSTSLLGLVPSHVLIHSHAAYVDAASTLLGGGKIIGVIATIVCIGTLNVWILTSSQIAYGLARDGLFPKIFTYTNQYGTPFMSVLISSALIIPLLFLTAQQNMTKQLIEIIDYSGIMILIVYAISSMALIKLTRHYVLGGIGFLCCVGIIAFKSWQEILVGAILILLGWPIYMSIKENRKK